MSHYLIGDDDFEFQSFTTFPLLEHVLGVGRMFCAPRFEIVDESGEPLADEDSFLSELGELAPRLFLPLHDDLVALPSAADLDLVLTSLLATLRTADPHILAQNPEGPAGRRVRWSLPFVWELRKTDWPALLIAINTVLPGKKITLEWLARQNSENVVERVLAEANPLGAARETLPEPYAFALSALTFVVGHDTVTFTVEDDTVFYEFDSNSAPPKLMSRLESPVLTEEESTRIEAVRAASDATLTALANEQPEDSAFAARTARLWTWGLRDLPSIARAYRASATSFLEQGELDRAITDASFSLFLEEDADAYDTRAIARHIAGDLDGAKLDYTHALALVPDDPRVLSNRAEAHYDLNDDQACLVDAGRAMELDPEDPDPIVHYGKALIRLGRVAEARSFAEKAAALGEESLLDEIGHYEG